LKGQLPGAEYSGGGHSSTQVKSSLTWKNGMKYYGLLTAIMWGGRSESGFVEQDFQLIGIDGSIVDLMKGLN